MRPFLALIAIMLFASTGIVLVSGCSKRNVYITNPSAPDSAAADSCHGKSCEHKK